MIQHHIDRSMLHSPPGPSHPVSKSVCHTTKLHQRTATLTFCTAGRQATASWFDQVYLAIALAPGGCSDRASQTDTAQPVSRLK